MRAEWRLVLALAGVDDTQPRHASDRLASLAARVQHWPAVIGVAHNEGALPLLAQLAASGAIPGMPPSEAARLQRMAPLAQFRAGILQSRLTTLVEAFAARDIKVVLLKGAALASTVYPRFADRAMGDLDLLVSQERSTEAFELARSLGWQLAAEDVSDIALDDHQHLRPLHDGMGLEVGLDLHVHLQRPTAPIRIDTDRFRREASRWGRTAAAVPSCEDLLLHACIHFVWSHCIGAGAWKAFRDVFQLLRHPAFDVQRFERLVQESRATSCAFWTLHLAHELGCVEAAGPLSTRFSAGTNRMLIGVVTRHFTTSLMDRRASELPLRMQRWLWEVAVQPERNQHGTTRPWDRDLHFARITTVDGPASSDLAGSDGRRNTDTDAPSATQRAAIMFHYLRSLLQTD